MLLLTDELFKNKLSVGIQIDYLFRKQPLPFWHPRTQNWHFVHIGLPKCVARLWVLRQEGQAKTKMLGQPLILLL